MNEQLFQDMRSKDVASVTVPCSIRDGVLVVADPEAEVMARAYEVWLRANPA